MSLYSWKKEFYPMHAHRVPKHEAALHSLRKWMGLRKHNLDRHKVWYDANDNAVTNGERNALRVNASSCALCVHFLHMDGEEKPCGSCPLSQYLGEPCCNTVFDHFCDTGDPEPMIEALKEVVVLQLLQTEKSQ